MIDLSCPSCGETVRVAESLAGEYVTCALCGERFTVSGNAAGAAELFPTEVPPVRTTYSELAGWHKLRVGLDIASSGAVLGVLGSIAYGVLVLLSLMVSNMRGFQGGADLLLRLFFFLGIAAFVGLVFQYVLVTTAAAISRSAPRSLGQHGRAGSALAWFVVSLLVIFLLPFMPMRGTVVLFQAVSMVSIAGYLVGFALLAQFLASVREELGDRRQSAGGYLVLLLANGVWLVYQLFGSPGLGAGRGFLPFERGGGGAAFAALISIAGIIVHLAWFNAQVRSTMPVVDRVLRSKS